MINLFNIILQWYDIYIERICFVLDSRRKV